MNPGHYLLFAWDRNDIKGGWNDFYNAFENGNIAKEIGNILISQGKITDYHVIEAGTGTKVINQEN